jgi:hypothetical protein
MRAKRESIERANAFVLGAAIEHSRATDHAVRVQEGTGWMCESCDPDLLPQFEGIQGVRADWPTFPAIDRERARRGFCE